MLRNDVDYEDFMLKFLMKIHFLNNEFSKDMGINIKPFIAILAFK